jgi:hypothetical protein
MSALDGWRPSTLRVAARALSQRCAAEPSPARQKTARKISHLWFVRDPNKDTEIIDVVWGAKVESAVRIIIGTGWQQWQKENIALYDDPDSAASDAFLRLVRFWKGEIPDWVFKSIGGIKKFKAWRPPKVAAQSEAPSAEGEFFDNPERREVRELAETEAVSNDPEVVEDAAQELAIPESEAVLQAEEAPPTPTEIQEEPGGKEFSTLNRFVVTTEEKTSAAVPSEHAEVPKHPDIKEAHVPPPNRALLRTWFG